MWLIPCQQLKNGVNYCKAGRDSGGGDPDVERGGGWLSLQDGFSIEQDDRREQILRSALDVISERGFPDTRIADVAERVGVSPALVIYYFKTKDHLLTEAMRHAEDAWYESGSRRLAERDSAAGKLEELVAMSTLPQPEDESGETWAVWLDLWAQSVRHLGVARVRQEFDERWRESIRSIVRDGCEAGEFHEVDAEEFTLGMSAMLDGFAIQIALSDPVVDGEIAFTTSMRFASGRLGFEWSPGERSFQATPRRQSREKSGAEKSGAEKSGAEKPASEIGRAPGAGSKKALSGKARSGKSRSASSGSGPGRVARASGT
jgi:AcrR family transcriptional regulator